MFFNLIKKYSIYVISDVYNLLSNKEWRRFDEIVLSKPQIVNSLRDGVYGRSLLMEVVLYADVFDHLLNFPQDFSIVNKNDWNIVHWIARFSLFDDVVCSRMLMKISTKTNVKSFINNKSKHGYTPLHRAANHNRHRTIETIVKLGGDVNIKDDNNKLPDEQNGCDDETKALIQRLRRQW